LEECITKEASVDGTHVPAVDFPRVQVSAWLSWVIPFLAIVLMLPIWLARLPAMPDFPAHLATFYLLATGAKEMHVAHFYHVAWSFVPNLAGELIVPALAALVPLLVATKIFLSSIVAMWVFGAAAIHKALYGRVGAAPLAASFFCYNANFMWGFFNYCFGTGLGFLVFAGWIANDGRRSPLRLLVFAVLVTAVYFSHLFAAATLLVAIGCYELAKLWEERAVSAIKVIVRALSVAAIFLPAFFAFVLLKPQGAGSGQLEFNLLSTLDDRASAAIQFSFDRPAYLLFVGLFLFVVIGLYFRKVTLHPRMRLLLALLAAAALFTPEWAMGGWGVDLRLPAVLGALVFAACEFRLRQRATQAFAAAVVVLVAFQSATLAGNWRYYSKQFSEFRAAISIIAPGSRLVTVLDGDAMGLASDQPYWHMAEYAIINRGDFTPLLFTTRGQHVVGLQPAVRHLAAATAQQGSPPDIGELDDLATGNIRADPDIRTVFPYLIRFQCHFDYAVVIHSGGKQTPPPDTLQLVHAGSFYSLYRILPSDDCSHP